MVPCSGGKGQVASIDSDRIPSNDLKQKIYQDSAAWQGPFSSSMRTPLNGKAAGLVSV
jgi:hypothetical protein